MDRSERARKAAQPRWAKTAPEDRKAALDAARAKSKPKADTQLKRLRTQAERLGYVLVPKSGHE